VCIPHPDEVRQIISEYDLAIMMQVRGSKEEDGTTEQLQQNYNWVYPPVKIARSEYVARQSVTNAVVKTAEQMSLKLRSQSSGGRPSK